jgi:hypothetical protein
LNSSSFIILMIFISSAQQKADFQKMMRIYGNIQECLRYLRVKYCLYINVGLLVWIINFIIQGDQKVSVHLTITIQKVTSNVQSVPHQSPDIYWQTPSVFPNSNYVIVVSDWNCLKYFLSVFLYCNHQVKIFLLVFVL